MTFLLWSQKSKTITASILVTGMYHCPKQKHTWGEDSSGCYSRTVVWAWEERCTAVSQMSEVQPGEALWAGFGVWRSPVNRVRSLPFKAGLLVPISHCTAQSPVLETAQKSNPATKRWFVGDFCSGLFLFFFFYSFTLVIWADAAQAQSMLCRHEYASAVS